MKSLLMTEKESSGVEGRGQAALRQKKQVGSAGLKEEEEEHMQLEERNIKMPLIHVKSFTCMLMFPITVKDMQKQTQQHTNKQLGIHLGTVSRTYQRLLAGVVVIFVEDPLCECSDRLATCCI